ncbi:MAG: hypothetical protein V8Q43_03980 [Christensenellaceae bacterium]
MGDENGAGKIEIINSKVEATSYYPALFTEGNLTVNGGKVNCTSYRGRRNMDKRQYFRSKAAPK